MRLLIPDASVILKWVLPPENEPGAREALAILDEFVAGNTALAVPALWYFEVANTVSRLAPDEASDCLRMLRRLGMAEISVDDSIENLALDCVRESGVTFYDAAYLATAAALGGVLVTADRRFMTRLGKSVSAIDLRDISVE